MFLRNRSTSTKSRLRRSRNAQLQIQPLESRQLLAVLNDVTVGFLELGNGEKVPNYVKDYTIETVKDGDWSDSTIWSTGVVPGDDDIVLVDNVVTYDVASAAAVDLESLGIINGSLSFKTDQNTHMNVGTIFVFESGTLEVGTVSDPVQSSYTAEIVFRDLDIDVGIVNPDGTVAQTGFDPAQYGIGLLGFGKVHTHGASMSETFVPLAANPNKTANTLELSQTVTGWNVGDTLIIPDTRQIASDDARDFDLDITNHNDTDDLPGLSGWEPQWEEVEITNISGTTITVDDLVYDHDGLTYEGGTLYPHVAVLDRNVTFRSENPHGTRGHMLFNFRADVDMRYSRFKDLGRTDVFRDLDRSEFETEGDESSPAEHIGENQIGRYSVHFHHLIGPENPTPENPTPFDPNGDLFQARLIGNTIDGGLKWGVTVHGTSYTLIEDNVAYDHDGAAFLTEDGNETDNVFRHNFAMRIQGTGVDGSTQPNQTNPDAQNYGLGGTGFWFARPGNIVEDNVVANASLEGYRYISAYVNSIDAPDFPGANRNVAEESTTFDVGPFGTHKGNEVYGYTQRGLSLFFPTASVHHPDDGTMTFEDFTIWNVHGRGVNASRTYSTVFEDFTIVGDKDAITTTDHESIGFTGFRSEKLTLVNPHIEGFIHGVVGYEGDDGWSGAAVPVEITGGTLKNFSNLELVSNSHLGDLTGQAMTVDGTTFDNVTGVTGPSFGDNDFRMAFSSDAQNILRPDTLRITDYDNVADQNFRVYYEEQEHDHTVSSTDDIYPKELTKLGLDNEELWVKYGFAIGGEVVPLVRDSSGTPENDLQNHYVPGLTISDLEIDGGFAIQEIALGPFAVNAGESFELDATGTFTQAGSYTYDWDLNPGWDLGSGDHIFDTKEATNDISPLISAANVDTYWPARDSTNPGVYPIGVRLMDGSTIVAEAWTTVTVRKAGTDYDATNDILYVSGDTDDNTIKVFSRDVGGSEYVVVEIDSTEVLNENSTSPLLVGDVKHVHVVGFEGDDTIDLSGVDSDFTAIDDQVDDTIGSAASETTSLSLRPEYSVLAYGLDGDDSLLGGTFSDKLVGGHGDDTLDGGTGADGYDALEGELGSDTYKWVGLDLGADTAVEPDFGAANEFGLFTDVDTLDFSGYTGAVGNGHANGFQLGLYKASGSLYQKVHDADSGNSHIELRIRLAHPNFEARNNGNFPGFEKFVGSDHDDYVRGASSRSTLLGGKGNDDLRGASGNDYIDGGEGNDDLHGNGGDDYVIGGDGNDTVRGHAGNDTLDGGTGNDSLRGEEGDDVYLFGRPSEAFNLGTDSITDESSTDGLADRLDFSGFLEALTIDISTASAVNHADLKLTIPTSSFEQVIGTTKNDTITGNSLDNLIDGGDDDDTIVGGAGNDTLEGGLGDDDLDGGSGDDVYVFDRDLVTDNLGSDTITEATGASNDDGDRLDFSGFDEALTVDLTGDDTVPAVSHAELTVTLTEKLGLEEIVGTSGNDTLTGNARDNVLEGGEGDDDLDGGAGSDTYVFARPGDEDLGSDTLTESTGGSDIDVLDFSDFGEGVTVDLSSTTPYNVSGKLGVTLSSADAFEGVIGSDFADNITGNGRDNQLTGGQGDDTLIGGTGVDTYLFSRENAGILLGTDTVTETNTGEADGLDFAGFLEAITIDLSSSTAVSHAEVTVVLTDHTLIESAGGTAFDDTLIGNDADNLLVGGEGDDTLEGGKGDDTLGGQGGDDTYRFARADTVTDLGSDVLVEPSSPNDAADTLDFSSFLEAITLDLSVVLPTKALDHPDLDLTLWVGGNFENVIGTDQDDSITGNSRNNVLEGGEGNDTLIGGSGDDTYVFDRSGGENLGSDDVTDSSGTADKLDFSAFGAGLLVDIGDTNAVDETGKLVLTLNSTTAIEDITGSAFDDTLFGNSQANSIKGLGGADGIDAKGGNDTSEGGAGADTLMGSEGSDTLDGGAGNDLYAFTRSTDSQDLAGEHLIEGTGTANDVEDILWFGLFQEAVTVDLTTATFVNQSGDLTLTVDDKTVFEIVIGSDDFGDTLTGNDETNILIGGGGNDTITGGAGDDFLAGQQGDDDLIGGTGNDYYVFDRSEGFDTDTDFGSDTVTESTGSNDVLDILDFSGFGEAVTVNIDDGLLDTTPVISHPDLTITLTSRAGIEGISGSSGADSLTGNSRANVLAGNGGNDTLVGLGNDDTYVFSRESDTEDLGTDTVTEASSGGDEDMLNFAGFLEAVTIDLSQSTAVSHADVTVNLSDNTHVEAATGTALDDTLIGNDAANLLVGGAGNDTLEGGLGDDDLDGGSGDDVYVFDRDLVTDNLGSDTITEATGASNDDGDRLDFSGFDEALTVDLTGDDTVPAVSHAELTVTLTEKLGLEEIVGTSGNDTLTGNARDNVLEGGEGDDDLDGGAGSDTYVFARPGDEDLGSDTLTESTGGSDIDVLDFSDFGEGVTVDLSSTTPYNVSGKLGVTLSSADAFEGVIGSDFADNITGNGRDNFLYGRGGNDIIAGNAGRDWLFGGTGADSLTGGDDEDLLMAGGLAANALDIDDLFDIMKEWSSTDTEDHYEERIDTLSGILLWYTRDRENGNSLLDDSTLVGDSDADTLAGSGDTDWFFYDAGEDTLSDLDADLEETVDIG